MSEQCPKTTRCKLCCENVGTSHDVKSLAVLAQKNSRALCREENFHKISCFLPIYCFLAKFNSPENFVKSANFSMNLSLRNWPLFFAIYRKPSALTLSLPLLKFYKFVLTMNELLKLWLCFRKEIVTDYHQLDQFLTDFYLRYSPLSRLTCQGFWQVAEEKVKFRGIFRDKLEEKSADFVVILEEFLGQTSPKSSR